MACLLSGIAFGLLAIFGKLAQVHGASLDLLLVVRFGLAGLVLLIAAVVSGRMRGLRRRTAVEGLLMGAVGYSLQAGLYFAGLGGARASLVALVFCTYPLLVMVLAVRIGREQWSRRRSGALTLALAGVVLTLGGATVGVSDLAGVSCAFAAAAVYTVYILIGERFSRTDPLALSALVCCGAFMTFLLLAVLRGGLDPAVEPVAWLWMGLVALVSTVAAILLFFSGLARVGPSTASLLSIVEPVVTVTAAALVFGDALSRVQLLGGGLVLVALAAVQWPGRGPRDVDAEVRDDPVPSYALVGRS